MKCTMAEFLELVERLPTNEEGKCRLCKSDESTEDDCTRIWEVCKNCFAVLTDK